MNNIWKNKNILIIGAARQGLALARYLANQGAQVTINDKKTAEQLQSAQAALAEISIEWKLGEHSHELLDGMDLVCISGGVPLTLPILLEAKKRGLPISNDSLVFLNETPCPVIGITGSAGKTTTTTLVGRMAAAAQKAPAQAWVGGNIGYPLIAKVNEMSKKDIAVMELSSFQLELMNKSPNISAVLNITPNHLDRHGTLEAYAAIKANILNFQNKTDTAVLGYEDHGAWSLADKVKGNLISFSFKRPPEGQKGTFYQDGLLYFYDGQKDIEIMSEKLIELRGKHNLLNVLAACAIAFAAGFPISAMQEGVKGLSGVEHRLEFIREYKGSKWYNDSKSTTPEGSIAGIKSFTEPLLVLLGGRDKNLPWDNLADLLRVRVDHLIVFGEAAGKILSTLGYWEDSPCLKTVSHCQSLRDAVNEAARIAETGDVVLLTPGGTSFDEFNNFEERGEFFKKWVKEL